MEYTKFSIFAVTEHFLLYRYHNPPHEELQIAAAEQLKITELRLLKLLDSQTRSIATASLAVLGAQKQIARRAGQLRNHLGGPHSAYNP